MTRKALGRGLSALLSADNGAVSTEDGHEVEMDLIDPSPVQPRSRFDESRGKDAGERQSWRVSQRFPPSSAM